jgi:hypothetical protein
VSHSVSRRGGIISIVADILADAREMKPISEHDENASSFGLIIIEKCNTQTCNNSNGKQAANISTRARRIMLMKSAGRANGVPAGPRRLN